MTSRLPVTRLILHCLPQEETLLLFTSPPACWSCVTQPPTWRSAHLAERSALFLTLWNLNCSSRQPGAPLPLYCLPLPCTRQNWKKHLCPFWLVFTFVSVDKKTELWERPQWVKKERANFKIYRRTKEFSHYSQCHEPLCRTSRCIEKLLCGKTSRLRLWGSSVVQVIAERRVGVGGQWTLFFVVDASLLVWKASLVQATAVSSQVTKSSCLRLSPPRLSGLRSG